MARRHQRVHAGGKVRQQPGELTEGLSGVQLVQIFDDQHDVATGVGELREHPVGDRPGIEFRCRDWRLRVAGRAAQTPDRVEQGKAEVLGVLLVALHLDYGELVRPIRPVRPRAQQRRLPAAGRSRDDRDPSCRRIIQGGEKITSIDQPEDGCHVTSLPRPGGCKTGDRSPGDESQRGRFAIKHDRGGTAGDFGLSSRHLSREPARPGGE